MKKEREFNFINKMINFKTKILKYFPENRKKWKEISIFVAPIFISSIIFSLNGFIDNFMVGHIEGGTAGIFAINAWTNILIGLLFGSAAVGSILIAQYYYSGHQKETCEVVKLRFIITILICSLMFILSFLIEDIMIKTFLPENKSSNPKAIDFYQKSLKNAKEYFSLLPISWLLISITFNYDSMNKEFGRGKFSLIVHVFALANNIFLNYLTMFTSFFGSKMGVKGAAIATIASRAIVFIMFFLYGFFQKLPYVFNPLQIFQISSKILKQFFKRITLFILTSATMFAIGFRSSLYSTAFPPGSIDNIIGSAAFLGITGSIFGIFAVTFQSIGPVVVKYVGGELGKNNIEKALENSKRIHGFYLIISIIMALILISFAFTVPYMKFLQNTGNKEADEAVLKWTKLSLMPIAAFYPWWIWIIISRNCTYAGGKVNATSIADFLITGPLQIFWLYILAYHIVPNSEIDYPTMTLLFYLSDLIKGTAFLWIFHRHDWSKNIVNEKI